LLLVACALPLLQRWRRRGSGLQDLEGLSMDEVRLPLEPAPAQPPPKGAPQHCATRRKMAQRNAQRGSPGRDRRVDC
jgi:hypothetical protein